MTTPPPVAGPVRVPLSRPAAPPPQNTSSSKGSLGRLLSTRNGQIGAAAVLVVVYALYRHYKSTTAAATAASTTAGTGIPTANTTATDLYSQLEPLVEQASGFTGTASILAQLQSLQNSLTAGQTTGAGTTGTTGGKAPGPLYPNQLHAVGRVGQNYNLMQLIHAYYPNATPQQQKEIGYATIANNPQLGSGVVHGGQRVTFYSQAVK